MTKKLILSQHCQIPYNSDQRLNNNVVVVGGSGTGKTTRIVTPNIDQQFGSLIIADPKGNLYDKHRKSLEQAGYIVKKINFTGVTDKESSFYNPFHYMHTDSDCLKIAHTLVYAGLPSTHRGDQFWHDASEMLLSAIMSYLMKYESPQHQNISTILTLLLMCSFDEDYSSTTTPLDQIFHTLPKDSFCYRSYMGFRAAAGRTIKSIIVSIYSMLFRYDTAEIRHLTSRDTLELDLIGDRKTALFIVISDTDRSLDPLVTVFVSQCLDTLVRRADNCPDYKLKTPVSFILDDFGTNILIPDIPKSIASIRSRNISMMLLLQSESQLRKYYGDDATTIINNCDSYVYLGGNNLDTQKQIAERANVELKDVLEMKPGYCYVFRRGKTHLMDTLFDPNSMLLL